MNPRSGLLNEAEKSLLPLALIPSLSPSLFHPFVHLFIHVHCSSKRRREGERSMNNRPKVMNARQHRVRGCKSIAHGALQEPNTVQSLMGS